MKQDSQVFQPVTAMEYPFSNVAHILGKLYIFQVIAFEKRHCPQEFPVNPEAPGKQNCRNRKLVHRFVSDFQEKIWIAGSGIGRRHGHQYWLHCPVIPGIPVYWPVDKKIAAVSGKGVITAKKAGKAKITVKSGKKKFTVTVTVTK